MKNSFKTQMLGAVVSAVILAGACAAAEKEVVSPEVTGISVEAGDRVSLTFIKSAGEVSVSEVRSELPSPVVIERQGSVILVKIAGSQDTSKPKSGRMTTSLKLHVPSGKNVTVLGKNLVVSGELAAGKAVLKAQSLSVHAFKAAVTEMHVEASYARLQFALTGAKALTVKSENASGRIVVPVSAKVTVPEAKELRIIRAGK
jgi:hypothetical protein